MFIDCWKSLTFLHYLFSNVSLNWLHRRMHHYTGCTCLIFSSVSKIKRTSQKDEKLKKKKSCKKRDKKSNWRKVKKSKTESQKVEKKKNQRDKKTKIKETKRPKSKRQKDKKLKRKKVFLLAFSCICFSIVLSNVLLQTIRQFAGEVTLLAGKKFLAGVRKHVMLQIIRLTTRVAALLMCKRLKGFSPEYISMYFLRLLDLEQK